MNYVTRSVVLWIDNMEEDYNEARALADKAWKEEARDELRRQEQGTREQGARYALAVALRELWLLRKPTLDGVWNNILRAGFHEVDWDEVADHYLYRRSRLPRHLMDRERDRDLDRDRDLGQ